MPAATVNGTSIHFTQAGEQHADAIVLLHGFPLNADMWAAQIVALSPRCRVIAPDFRGFGRSATTGPFTIEQLADDVRALVEQLGLGRVVLAGLSMGGYVAIPYAKKYPDTLRGLILLDTKAEPDNPEGKQNRDRMIAIVNEKGAKPIADLMIGKLIPEFAAKSRPQLVRDLRQMMDSTNPQTIAHALAAMRDRPDQTPALHGITVPTLAIAGERDAITPPDVMRAMQQKIPTSQLKVITGSGHMPTMEQPAQVNATIAEFLTHL